MISDRIEKDCPIRQVLDFMGEKWVPALVHMLSEDAQRLSDLARRIPGISKKMLTQTLRNLERWGLVRRKVYPVVPPRVEYSLTALGERFAEPLEVLCRWAEENQADVRKMTKRRVAPQLISAPFRNRRSTTHLPSQLSGPPSNPLAISSASARFG